MKNILQNIFLFFALLLFGWGYGQVQTGCNIQKTWTINNFTTGLSTSSTFSSFSSLGNLTDGNLSNSSNWTSVVINPIAHVEIRNNQTFAAGTYAGIVLSETSVASVSTTYKVETYNDNTATGDFIQVNVPIAAVSSSNRNLGLISTKPFNRIRLTITTIGITTTSVYYAYTLEPCTSSNEPACNINTPITQSNYASVINYANNRTGTSGLTVGNITNLNNIVNNDTDDFATMSLGASAGASAQVSVRDLQRTYEAGSFTGFEISNSNLLNLDLLNGTTIITYLNGIEQERSTSGSLIVNLSILGGSNRANVGFTTTKNFNEVQYVQKNLLGLNIFGSTQIYNMIVRKLCEGPEPDCYIETPFVSPLYPASIQSIRTGTSGVANLSTVSNADNVINSNTNDYASLSINGLLASAYLSVSTGNQGFNGGQFVGFDIENTNLLNAELLGGTVIKTYLKGNPVEQSNSNTMIVDLNILNRTPRAVVGFVTTLPFDEVQIEMNTLLSVNPFGETRVYNLIFKKLCEGPDLTCNQRTILDDSIYPISISDNTGVEGLLSLGSVTEPRNAIDNDPTTYASMNIFAGAFSKATLAIKKSLSPYPANTYVSFEVENSSLLNLSVLSNYGIRLLRNGVQVGIAEGNNLLVGANLLDSSRKTIGFKAPAEFDEIQFIINNAGLSADLGVTKVHNVKVMQPCAVPINCDEEYVLNDTEFPVVINALRTGPTSAACVGCSVKNPENILSNNNTNFATLNIPVGLLSGVSVSVEDLATVYPAGTKVGFTVNDVPDILQLDLLESLQITTYLNGVPQETASAAELLDLSLIFNITGTGIKNYGFQTSLPFDEVQLTVFSVLNAFNEMNVYNLRIDTKNSNGEGLICIGNPFAEDDTFTLNPGQTSTTSVVDNDVSNNLPAVIGQNVQISQISSSNTDIILNSNGQVVVGANVLPGIYQLEYRICNIDSPTSCDTAIIQVIVKGINDIDGDGIPDDIDLDNDNDGILDSEECFSINHISSSGNGNFPKSLGNVDQTNQWITSNNWIVGGNYALSGDWTEASGRGRINFGINGLSFLRDNNTTTSLSKTDITSNLNGSKITFNNVKWLYTLPNNGTQEDSNSDRSFVLQVYVRGVHYMNILSGNGTENGPVIQTLNGASTNVTNLASYIDLPVYENHNTWSPSQSIILSLPISGVPSDQLSSTDFELRFLAGASITRVRDLAIESISLESCRDLDNDGLQDYLDTDSDNDGCLDAIEGGDNVKPEQLKTNGQINSPVDATGVPTLVNFGGTADVDGVQGQSTNNGKPYNPADTSECPTFCVKPGDRSTNGTPSIIGISTLSKQLQTWPENIPNGFIALESKEKGFVITTVNNVNTILDPKPGMIVYDNSEGAKCIKLYSNSGPGNTYQWKCIERTCNQ